MDASTNTDFSFMKAAGDVEQQEVTSPCREQQAVTPKTPNVRGFKWSLNIYENIATGLNAFALLASIAIVGTSGNALAIYHKTTTGPDFGLPLWPKDFTLKPTAAFVGTGTVTLVLNFVAIYMTLVWQYHSNLRAKPFGLSIITYTSALLSLVCNVTGVALFYHDNKSNNWTMQSWSCQWRDVSMSSSPHWDRLCGQSKASLYLSIVLIPVMVLSLANVSLGARKTDDLRRSAIAEEIITAEKLDSEARMMA